MVIRERNFRAGEKRPAKITCVASGHSLLRLHALASTKQANVNHQGKVLPSKEDESITMYSTSLWENGHLCSDQVLCRLQVRYKATCELDAETICLLTQLV